MRLLGGAAWDSAGGSVPGRQGLLTAGDLARINQISYNADLLPQQSLIVYIPITPAAKKEAQGRLRKAARLLHAPAS